MFVSRIRAGADDRSPWGNFWFEPVGMRSISGMRVSSDAALRLTAVYGCVRVLAETFASMPFVLYQANSDGSKTVIRDHWLNNLFNKRPNRYQNRFEWREMCQGHLALRGNCFNRIVANGRGEITELIPIHPDRITIEMLKAGDYRYRVKQQDGSDEVLARTDVWHIRGLSSDGLIGLNPIEIARDAVGMGLAAQEYGARFFANDARPSGGWIEMATGFSTDGARKTFRESWQAAQAGMNRGKVPVLENGMKYHEVGVNNKDSQFLEARQFQVAEIARLFRVPPHLIGDLSRSTNNNIEQQSLEFATYTMTPWGERWEASIEADLLLEGDALEVEFDFANMLRGDSKSRAEYYSSAIQNGWLTRNEVRLAENRNPIDGLDEPLQPLNMANAADAEPDQDPDDAPTIPAPEQDEGGSDARLVALADAACTRIARKETAEVTAIYKANAATPTAIATFYTKHANFIAGALGVAEADAGDYCLVRKTLVASGNIELQAFEDSAFMALRRLALKGKA